MTEPHGGQSSTAAGNKTSPVRLAVLLAILAIAVGALAYDQLYARQAAVAASKKLTAEADKHNGTGYDMKLTPEEKKQKLATGVLGPKDVRRILNMSPTRVVTEKDHVIEFYRWWGYIPINRHFVAVVYLGREPYLRYSTHYTNIAPPKETLPGYVRTTEGQNLPPAGAGMPALPGSGPPDPSAEKGKGKGKGSPEGAENDSSEPEPPSEVKNEGEDAESQKGSPADQPAKEGAAKADSEETPESESPAATADKDEVKEE